MVTQLRNPAGNSLKFTMALKSTLIELYFCNEELLPLTGLEFVPNFYSFISIVIDNWESKVG